MYRYKGMQQRALCACAQDGCVLELAKMNLELYAQ